jgi:hypothetical protein
MTIPHEELLRHGLVGCCEERKKQIDTQVASLHSMLALPERAYHRRKQTHKRGDRFTPAGRRSLSRALRRRWQLHCGQMICAIQASRR